MCAPVWLSSPRRPSGPLLPTRLPFPCPPKGCEVVHLWGSVARGYHHKRNESSPENIKRVRDRCACLYYFFI